MNIRFLLSCSYFIAFIQLQIWKKIPVGTMMENNAISGWICHFDKIIQSMIFKIRFRGFMYLNIQLPLKPHTVGRTVVCPQIPNAVNWVC